MNASWGGPPKQPMRNSVKEYELVLYCAAVLLAAGTKRSLSAHAESGISRTLLLRFSWRDIASSRVAQPQANRDYVKDRKMPLWGAEVLLAGAGRHLLDHGDYQLAIAVVQVGRVAANLRQETHFVLRQFGYVLVTVVTGPSAEELRQRDFHRRRNFSQRIQGGNGVSVLDP